MQLGTMAALYAGVIALLNLLFRVINVAFPKVQGGYMGYYYYGNPISLPVATLIIVTPLFLGLTWYLHKTYAADPTLRENALRKWLIYVTLFIAGIVIAADLITLLYHFIDGQELTTGFLLKVVTVLVVALSVFGYYIQDMRGQLTKQRRMAWRIFAALLVIGSIIAGFRVIGSPATQRAYRYDSERVSHLQQIQGQVVYYWQQKGSLPVDLTVAADPLSDWKIPNDPLTGDPYTYERIGELSFRLCAEFQRETAPNMGYVNASVSRPMYDGLVKGGDYWQHPAGRHCFERTIDPDFYPPRAKM